MEASLSQRTVCMQHNLNQLLFYNMSRFSHVMRNKLVNKSSRDASKKISEKCCRTYQCNARKCLLSDPEKAFLTPDIIYRRNHHMWVKGKHLMCDLMKKHVNTKKNDIQPALKKMFEWLNWEMSVHPCPCEACKKLRVFLKEGVVSHKQFRCPQCLCGLKEHECLDVSCHINGVCQGRKMCSFCLKYKPQCAFGFMVQFFKERVAMKDYTLLRFACDSSAYICNSCFITTKREKFMNLLTKRKKLSRSLNPEDVVVKATKKKQKILPEDILFQDLNWENTADLTFMETKEALQDYVQQLKDMSDEVEEKKKSHKRAFIEKVKLVQKGECNDKTLIEQIVMLVEKKSRENIQVDIDKGVVNLVS
jgi:hypothetical protein